MSRRLISSGSEFESKIGYSRTVVDGDYVFVSGTTGYDYESMAITDNPVAPVAQAEQYFQNIQKALHAAGSSLTGDQFHHGYYGAGVPGSEGWASQFIGISICLWRFPEPAVTPI